MRVAPPLAPCALGLVWLAPLGEPASCYGYSMVLSGRDSSCQRQHADQYRGMHKETPWMWTETPLTFYRHMYAILRHEKNGVYLIVRFFGQYRGMPKETPWMRTETPLTFYGRMIAIMSHEKNGVFVIVRFLGHIEECPKKLWMRRGGVIDIHARLW